MGTVTKLSRKHRGNTMPDADDILSIRKADSGEYQLSDREVLITRRKIYKINKEDRRGRKFATRLIGDLLMVWRYQ